MRKLLIVVGMACAFIASEACAAKWVAVLPGGPKTTSLKYMTGSAYVEKGTGLVRIMLCTLEPCSDNDDGPATTDLVNDTDAVIDCSQETITWSDPMEQSHVDQLKGAKANLYPKSEFATVIKRTCAKKASLPKR